MMRQIPNPLLWHFQSDSLRGKQYLKDLDFLKAHTDVDMVVLATVAGVQPENLAQCHDAMKELVEYAHQLGIKVSLRLSPQEGFHNAQWKPSGHYTADQEVVYTIADQSRAEGLVHDYELQADENGQAVCFHRSKWARPKLRPLRNEILKIYAFEKTGEGFYRPDTLADVTNCARIVSSMPNAMEIEIDAGKENAGKTLFVMVAQYSNYYELFGDSHWEEDRKLLDAYADVPFDGISHDEFGYMLLNVNDVENGVEEPFRGRLYSPQQRAYYQKELGIDLHRMLLDMRYAPQGNDGVRIRAINRYFDELRQPPLRNEWNVAAHAKKLYGEDVYLGVHNTFHNHIERDEVWHTVCNWWDLPRRWGHTDENITMPVRMGVMMAAEEPLMLAQFYTKPDHPEEHYQHMIQGAPFNCREFHHAFRDFYWGCSFTDEAFLENIRILDRKIAALNAFQNQCPRLDLLVIYGNAAKNNWYPNESARSKWDIDGTLNIQDSCDAMWQAGYRCAMVPDYAIEDGRIQLEGNRISFNGHPFTHCLFLYPKYAKKATYALLNQAHDNGLPLAVVGEGNVDFDAEPAQLHFPCFDTFTMDVLESIRCPKSAIEEGSLYWDGSFVLASEKALLGNEQTPFDFCANGVRYTGVNTGILAYREGETPICTPGCNLFRDGKPVDLSGAKLI